MLRYSAVTLLAFCGFAGSASAATIGLQIHQSRTFDQTLDVDDPSFQAAIIAAAPSDWRLTPGADVWWASLDGVNVHVTVFPALEHPGNGTPQCCLTFVQGDTQFWLKVRRATAGTSPDNTSGGNGSLPSDGSGGDPGGLPAGGPGFPNWPEMPGASGPTNPGDPGAPGSSGGAEPGAAPGTDPGTGTGNGSGAGPGSGPGSTPGSDSNPSAPDSTQGPTQDIIDVSEPGLLALLGLGLFTVARTARKRA
jgi:hypothetical protein